MTDRTMGTSAVVQSRKKKFTGESQEKSMAEGRQTERKGNDEGWKAKHGRLAKVRGEAVSQGGVSCQRRRCRHAFSILAAIARCSRELDGEKGNEHLVEQCRGW